MSNNPIKHERNIWTDTHKIDVSMVTKDMKMSPVPLVIRKMWISTTMRYLYMPKQNGYHLKSGNKNISEGVKQLEVLYTISVNVKRCKHIGQSSGCQL